MSQVKISPLLTGRHAYRDREDPDTITSTRGCGLFTGQMVDRLASTSCDSRRPVEASRMSTGCRATPPKSSEMYLHASRPQSMSAAGYVTHWIVGHDDVNTRMWLVDRADGRRLVIQKLRQQAACKSIQNVHRMQGNAFQVL